MLAHQGKVYVRNGAMGHGIEDQAQVSTQGIEKEKQREENRKPLRHEG